MSTDQQQGLRGDEIGAIPPAPDLAGHPPAPQKARPWWHKSLLRAVVVWFALGGWGLVIFPMFWTSDSWWSPGLVVLLVSLLSVAWYAFWAHALLGLDDPNKKKPPEF
jgi:hypothetical protein